MPGLPERITGGKRYEFTLVLRDPKSRVGGFQLMVDADNDRRGELIPVDGQQVEEHQGIQYLGHSEPRAMATDEASGERVTRWQIIWRAPADPGMIRVFATSVAGDDDMSPLGDNVYRLQATLTDKSN